MRSLALLLFVLSSVSFYGQNKTVYLDSLQRLVERGNHVAYRVTEDYDLTRDLYKVVMYTNADQKTSEFYISDKDKLGSIEGIMTTFRENGAKSSETEYKNGESGSYRSWYDNGDKNVEGKYLPHELGKNYTKPLYIENYWDSDNVQKVVNGNGDFTSETEEGKFKNGLRDGAWKGRYRKKNFIYTELYDNGKFVSGTSVDENGQVHQYSQIEVKPSPRKGVEHFYKFIGKKMAVPDRDITGKIILNFFINKQGEITDVQVLKGIDPETDAAAVKVVEEYKDWIPGMQRGVPVRVLYSLPISIQGM